jgi:SAM-dependent methyltransferase
MGTSTSDISPAGRIAAAGSKRKNASIAGILGGMAFSLSKVLIGYVGVSIVLGIAHYQYQVDDQAPPRKIEKNFYADIYAAPAASSAAVVEEDSKYVRVAREMIHSEGIVPRVTAFAEKYGFRNDASKRVLEVGAGTGYLQDVVPNYVGLDISPSAKRYFHKPFVEASATEMPFPDSTFDGLWSVWVLEHVPKPEHALNEIRRVVKDGGILYLKPAWFCKWWYADGYEVRPYSDFGWAGKAKKASLNLLAWPYYRYFSMLPARFARKVQVQAAGGPSRLHYDLLNANYKDYWVPDSDAVAGLDYYEMLLWFQSRGDECLNCSDNPIFDAQELVIRVHKR